MAQAFRKHHQRTIDRIHLVVRLELGNPLLSSSELARLIGISPASYLRLRKLPIYHQIHNQYFSAVITRLDDKVDENFNVTKETLKFAVPVAMQALLKQAMQVKDLRLQNKACNDILDRDGHFAKVKRVGLATTEQGGITEDRDNKVAEELIRALTNNKPATTQQTQPTQPDITAPPITETKQ